MARRGPPSSTQRPNTAAEPPRNSIASEKIQPSSVSFQSPGTDWLMPRSLVIGRLKTLSAYACPIHRCTHSAAGGTIQRLNPGFATVCSRSRNDNTPIGRFLPQAIVLLCARHRLRPLTENAHALASRRRTQSCHGEMQSKPNGAVELWWSGSWQQTARCACPRFLDQRSDGRLDRVAIRHDKPDRVENLGFD